MVACVFPFLGYRDFGLFGGIAVDHIVAVVCGGVAVHSLFCDVVIHLFAVYIFGKIGKAPAPIVIFGNDSSLDPLAVSQQINNNHLGAFAVSVVIILPILAAAYLNQFIGVGDGQAGLVVVVAHRNFFDAVFVAVGDHNGDRVLGSVVFDTVKHCLRDFTNRIPISDSPALT